MNQRGERATTAHYAPVLRIKGRARTIIPLPFSTRMRCGLAEGSVRPLALCPRADNGQ